MDIWLGIGIFCIGAAIGSLATRIATHGHIHRLKDEIVGMIGEHGETLAAPVPTEK